MASALTNRFLSEVMKKTVDLVNDAIKVCLMASGFVFDKDAHNVWNDVSASELAAGNGYTQNATTLSGQVVAEDDANHLAKMTCTNPSWTASGGGIGPTPGAILYDATHPSSIIIGYIDFGGNVSASSGVTFTIQNITVKLQD